VILAVAADGGTTRLIDLRQSAIERFDYPLHDFEGIFHDTR